MADQVPYVLRQGAALEAMTHDLVAIGHRDDRLALEGQEAELEELGGGFPRLTLLQVGQVPLEFRDDGGHRARA